MLDASAVVAVVIGVAGGASVFFGRREKRQWRGPDVSRHPVSMISLSGLNNWTECFLDRTVQSSSQSFPMPSKECWKPVMMWASVTGRSILRWNESEDACV